MKYCKGNETLVDQTVNLHSQEERVKDISLCLENKAT